MTETNSSNEIVIGVLALQGAFLEHLQALRTLNQQLQSQSTSNPIIKAIEVRTAADLASVDGLILPGGESTAMALVAQREQLLDHLVNYTHSNKPVFGTCAGLILLSDQVKNQKIGGQQLFGGLNVEVQRNHYGTQLGSFQTILKVPVFEKLPSLDQSTSPTADAPAVFIRAPGITRTFANVEILASVPKEVDSAPVKQGSFTPSNKSASSTDEQSNKQSIDHTSSESSIVPVAVRQGNMIGTTFHPELTPDLRWHQMFIEIVKEHKQKQTTA